MIWIDAILAPKALDATRMVFGDPAIDDRPALGNRLFLPVAGDGFAYLAELNFDVQKGPGLFGYKEQLLQDWRQRLAIVTANP